MASNFGKCWISRDAFLNAVGVVNAEVTLKGQRGGVKFKTKYREVALRIASLGRGINAKTLSTTTDEGIYVVTVQRFRKEVKA